MNKFLQQKLVALGDGGCGKTSLLTVFTQGYFPTTYEPTVFENFIEVLQVDGHAVELSLWDTAGQEDYDRLRSLCYSETDVVLVCFSVDMPTSLENIETKWMPEIRSNCPGASIILAALKCDLRSDEGFLEKMQLRNQDPVGYDEGLAVARRIKAKRYFECSAKLNRGVQETIYACAQVGLASRPAAAKLIPRSLRSRCMIL